MKKCDIFPSFTAGFSKRIKLRLKSERALNEVFTAYLSRTCSSCGCFFVSFSALKSGLSTVENLALNTKFCSMRLTYSSPCMVNNRVYWCAGFKSNSSVQHRKRSPTANDPQTRNDPQMGPQRILDVDHK